jgi:hypothetical protein
MTILRRFGWIPLVYGLIWIYWDVIPVVPGWLLAAVICVLFGYGCLCVAGRADDAMGAR